MYAGRGCSRPSCWSGVCPAASCSTPSGSTTIPGFDHVLGPRAGRTRWPTMRSIRRRPPPGDTSRSIIRRDDGIFEVATTGGNDLRGARRHPDGGRHPDQAGRARRAGVRRPGSILLRGVRRRLLQGRDHRRDRRRRRRGGGGRLPDALRREGVRDSPARRVPGLEDPAGAALRQPEDRGPLEPAGQGAAAAARRARVARAGGHGDRASDLRSPPPGASSSSASAQHRTGASTTSRTTPAAT